MAPWPNIEEFDLVIIAQNTLLQKGYDQIIDKLKAVGSQIRTLFKTGRSVWCIIDKKLVPSNNRWVQGYEPTSYDWLFVCPKINEVLEGATVTVVDKSFAPYLQKVKRWTLEVESVYTWRVVEGSMEPSWPDEIVLEPIAVNKSKKMLGARILFDPEKYESGVICLLPKPTECDVHEAIETLIDIATGEERVEPEWMGRLEIPGLSEIVKKIDQLKLDYDKQKSSLDAQRQSLEEYRDIFSVHEAPQIKAIKSALRDIGFETERTVPGFQVDLRGPQLAVEITSITGKVDSTSPKMFQLMQFLEKSHKKEKVVLIANTFKRDLPANRVGRLDFTSQVVGFLQANEVCAMTCVTLFGLWKLARKDQQKAKELILKTNGELKL